MNGDDLDFKDTCLFYPTTIDDYGKEVLGTAEGPVPCIYEQTTGYQHGGSQDAIVSSSRLALPATNSYLEMLAYRLENQIVEINVFGGSADAQRFKVISVTPARDLLLGNETHHLECQLKKIEASSSVS